MVGVHEEVYRIKAAYLYGRWGIMALLLLSSLVIPYKIATDGQAYPDLNLLLTCYSIAGFLWIVAPFDSWTVTAYIETTSDGFWLKKLGQKARWHPYSAIMAYNERPNSTRMESFDELTLYLTDAWFVLRSNEYRDYADLKDLFTQYGKAGQHQNVITVPERNLIRWLIGATALIILINIVFGFLAHNDTDSTPAHLVTIRDGVSQAKEIRNKGRLKGVTISLITYPNFSFYLSRREYTDSLAYLVWAVDMGQPIELTIRESELRRKLSQTEPLTFGDKYSDFRMVDVFAAQQTTRFHIESQSPVYEPKRTNPILRTMLLGMLLILCWTGWVYVDQHRLLRAT
ncbi:hypothetical protein [Spirosoma utsteinense]|uniref:DUF3592 domain-containing protein n=1 Tax=Spirosoma utsteinense TaxID=2585773 RepID=A0ABR6W5E1_9BACT|nr:hypothetical protein [Spirosoma utsteinense]MBC3785609.1 hypothetical protein [Spirosoma utsteinense]MBC3791760.1 hypothetical protein [Spirosoma utsteinense]